MFSLMYNMVFWLLLLIITIDLLPVSCSQINTDVCCDACAKDEQATLTVSISMKTKSI